MRSILRVRPFVLACCAVLVTAVSAAAQSGGGSNVRFANIDSVNFPLTNFCVQNLNFTNNAASTKVLIITSTVHDNDAGCTASNVYLNPVVTGNPGGIVVEPISYLQFKTPSSTICTDTRTSQWWIDISASGLSGKTLSICMEGSAFPSINLGVSTTAILQAK